MKMQNSTILRPVKTLLSLSLLLFTFVVTLKGIVRDFTTYTSSVLVIGCFLIVILRSRISYCCFIKNP